MKKLVATLALAACSVIAFSGVASAKAGCEPFDTRDCLLPFPSNHFTTPQRGSATGLRLNFNAAVFPKNVGGVSSFTPDLNNNDGFSPGAAIMTYVDGISLQRSGAVPITDIGSYSAANAPIVLVDAKSGKRQPIWVELDANPENEADGSYLVMIRPARNLPEGRRYIVALRNLKNGSGATIPAGAAFASVRDGKASGALAVRARRMKPDFDLLGRIGIKRSTLYLAWDFTVASERNLTERALAMRNASFAALGDKNLADQKVAGSSPKFQIDKTINFSEQQNALQLRQIEGTMTVPCYLSTPDCAPGGTFRYQPRKAGKFNWIPKQQGTMEAKFVCGIPRSALDKPARPVIYGHGLLGSAREALGEKNQFFGNKHGILFCATDEIGMAGGDALNAIKLLGDMSLFASFPDRLQQGLLNGLMLGRLMIHAEGLASHPSLRSIPGASGRTLIDRTKLAFNGNSQGGILGPAITALAPDFTRAVLGVPGMNYSLLLPRSVDFDEYSDGFFAPSYPNRLKRLLILAAVQNLWDRGEGNGYALHATDDPLPGTPKHQVLLEAVVGDHQVPQVAAENLARTVGAVGRRPAYNSGRSFDKVPFWGIRSKGKSSDSRLVIFDSGPIRQLEGATIGTNVPPLTNTPPRAGQDPHGLFDISRGQQAADFFDGRFTDVCPTQQACRLSIWPY